MQKIKISAERKDDGMLIMFGMSLPGGYISSLRNQAKEMLEVKRLAVEFTT